MKIARNIALVLSGIVIWIVGFVFVSLPVLDEWNDCQGLRNNDTSFGLTCHAYEGSYGGCDASGLCVDGYSSEISTSVFKLGAGFVLPAVPLIVVIAIPAKLQPARSAGSKKPKVDVRSTLKKSR